MKSKGCLVCHKTHTGENMVQCSSVKCNSWTHISCDQTLKNLSHDEIEGKDFKFKCISCRAKEQKQKVSLVQLDSLNEAPNNEKSPENSPVKPKKKTQAKQKIKKKPPKIKNKPVKIKNKPVKILNNL